jgi:hypothetical protein
VRRAADLDAAHSLLRAGAPDPHFLLELHSHVYLARRDDLPAVIVGFGAAWALFGRVSKVFIPDDRRHHHRTPTLIDPTPVHLTGADGLITLPGEMAQS